MSDVITIGELLVAGTDRLASVTDVPRLEAEVLLAGALGKGRAFLYAWPETAVAPAAQARYAHTLERRRAGEPIGYITGWREFWSLELEVTRATLIPRPETERLVELALEHLAPETPAQVADIGTGTGAIAIAIAVERPRAHVVATDVDAACVNVARRNAARLDVANIEVHAGDLCAPLGERSIDLMVSNPPYVADGDPHLETGDLRFEPARALRGGVDGLDLIRRLASEAPAHLARGAPLLLEHGHDQGTAVRGILREAGFGTVQTYRDYGGRERVTQARRGHG